MELMTDHYQKCKDQELRQFLATRLGVVSRKYGEESETARLYRERLEELDEVLGEVLLA